MFTVRESNFYEGFNIWQGVNYADGLIVATVLYGNGRVLKTKEQAKVVVEKILNILTDQEHGTDTTN